MKRVLGAVVALALLTSGVVGAAPAAHALDSGTFTVSGWTSGNLTINGLTISRDIAGTYTVTALSFTVGSRSVTVNGFDNRGCTPAGGECHEISAAGINVKDNFAGYWFTASFTAMDTSSPTLTMYDAKTSGNFWDGFGSSPSTGFAATLVPSTPSLTSMSPNTAALAGGGTAEITGANLSGATGVSIGVRQAAIVATTDGKVVVTIPVAGNNPVGSAVDVTVTTPLGTATLASAFTYTANPPGVGSVTPSCGIKAGTTLVIGGASLTGASSVTIGGTSVAFTVTDSTHISAVAPALSDIQPVVVTTAAGASGGLATVSYRACAPLPPLTLKTTSTSPAGGFATIQWSFPAGDPNLGNVLGLQYALALGGPFVNVGGVRAGTSGSFTVAGLTKSPMLVWVKTVNANPTLGKDAIQPVGVTFASSPTPLPPNTGNAGKVPPPAASGGSPSPGSGSDSVAVTAPCLATSGSLYPPATGTVGSQLVVVPGRPGDPSPSEVTVTSGALPPGMGLDSVTGIVYGVPSLAGKYSAGVAGHTADGTTARGTLDITIDNNSQTLTYPVLVIGIVGRTLTTGPTTNAPIGSTYEITCGKLPPGTKFDTRTGVITGTPTTVDLANPPLRIVERNAGGTAAASFLFVVSSSGGAAVSYPGHPHLRAHTRTRIRPSVIDAAAILYFKVVRGKLVHGLRLNPKTGVVTGRPHRVTGRHPHHVTVAAVLKDGSLLSANPMTMTVRHHR